MAVASFNTSHPVNHSKRNLYFLCPHDTYVIKIIIIIIINNKNDKNQKDSKEGFFYFILCPCLVELVP